MGEQPTVGPPPPRRRRRLDPKPLRRREVAVLMLVWSGAMGGWFALTAVNSGIDPVAVVSAVGGLIGVIWLLGVMILALLLVGGE